jgi:hypothetical protein
VASPASSRDPWKDIKLELPTRVTSTKSAKNILSQIGSIQTSRSGIKALGGKEKPKTKKGFVSGIFDPDRGLLFAPYRAISAGAADVLGLAQDTELADYNPLESALRAARGEFSITGGDIIRTEEGDSIPERVAKLGGAFAWDVVTDPLNYVGGAGVFARKGILAATLGDDALRVNLVRKLENFALQKKSANEVTSLLDQLAGQSREVLAGKVLFDDAGRLVDEAGEALSKEARDSLAARTLANTIADSFTTGGRGAIIPALTKAVGDKEVAEAVFKSLDRELIGGLFLKNPITGKPIVRIAGGSGKGNVVADAANQLRFRTSAGFAGRWGSRDLSGRFGPTYAAYKQGLLGENFERLGVGRTLFTDFTDYRNQARLFKSALAFRMSKLHSAQSQVLRARKQVVESERDMFDEQLKYFFHNPTAELADAPKTSQLARASALEIRKNFEEAMDEFRELNVQLGYQENFTPLMYSDEYIDHVMKVDPKQGRETRGGYRGNLNRVAYLEPKSVGDLEDVVPVGQLEQLSAMSPIEANRVANPVLDANGNRIEIFETDPVKILERYATWGARTIETSRFVRSLEAAGVVIHRPAETMRTVNIYNAAAMANAVGKVTPETTSALRQRLRALKEQMADLVSDDTVAAREAERAGLLSRAQAEYDEANTRLVEAVAYLRELNKQLALFEPSVAKIKALILNKDVQRQIRALDRVERTVSRFAQDVQNAKSRLARAESNAAVTARSKELLEQQGKGEPILVWDPQLGSRVEVSPQAPSRATLAAARKEARENAQKVKQLENELTDELEDLRDVRESLSIIKEALDENAEFLATEQFQDLLRYMAVMEEKSAVYSRVKEIYRPARNTAKDNLFLLNRDVSLPRAETLRTAALTYVELRRRYLFEVTKVRSIPAAQRTSAVKAKLKAAREAMKEAQGDLVKLVADVNPNMSKVQTAGRSYVKEILRLADTLSTEQVAASFAFADAKKLGRLVEALNDPTIPHDVRMRAYGDMMAAYRSVRRYVGEDQLRVLDNYERRIYDEPTLVFETRGEKFTAKINILRNDLDAARQRGDQAEIERLSSEIDKLDVLTEEDGLRLIGAGKVKVPQSLEDMYAPMGVRQVMERLYQIETNPTEWETFIGRVYDPLSLVWKTAATVGRGPAYTFTNLIGGLLNNFIGGVSARDHALAAKVLSVYDRAIRAALKETPDLDVLIASGAAVKEVRRQLGSLKIAGKPAVEIFEEFLDSGTWLTTDVMAQAAQLRRAGLLTDPMLLTQGPGIVYEFTGEPLSRTDAAFRKTVNGLLTWRGQRFMNDVNQNTEMYLRLAAFISGYERFGSKFSAVDNVMLLHFDYQDLSDAEQWFKRFVPFYTWTRNNVPLQLRAAFLQQDRIRKLIVLNENIKDAFGADGNDEWLAEVLPDYIDINGGFASAFKFADNHLAFFPKTPINDVDQLFAMGSVFGIPIPVPRLQEAAQMLGPAVSPLEFITKTNFDTGQQFRSNEEMALQLSRSLIPYIGTAQRIASGLTVPATLAGADLSGVPFVQADRGLSNLYNFLVGAPFGATTLTERSIYGGLIQRSIASSKQLRKLADEAGVDVEWLRKEIKKGVSLPELRGKIARGEGNVARLESQKRLDVLTGKAQPDGPARDYVSMMRQFRSGGFGG